MSQFNKSRDVEIGSIVLDGANVPTYKAKERDLRLHAKAWLPEAGKNPDHHYFEIQVLSMGTSRKISLGVTDSAKCSFEYRTDGKIYYDGKLIKCNKEVRFDQKNAIVGCGIDFTEQKLFFVLSDGSKVFYPTSRGSTGFDSLIPFVTLNNKGENIAVNFGERKFMHDPFNEKVTGPSYFAQNRIVEFSIEEDQTTTINTQDKANYRSLQANRPFDRTNPKALPYFELQVIKADAHVMMGFSDVLFDMNAAIGKMRNSCGWTDARQSYDHSTNHSGLLIQTFGDIFGCGITMDSYNSHRIFITKNGKWIGFVGSGKVPPFMDCFPTISILGSATISYNFEPTKFSWDFKNMPKFPRTSSINAIPIELLQQVFDYAGHSGSFAVLSISVVNKKWRKTLLEQDPLWRRVYYKQFPNQTPDLKVKNWYKFYTRRAQAMKTVNDPHPIENCSLAFECPMILENFKNFKEGDTKVFCDKCQKDVHVVGTIGELHNHASLGHCVAWKVRKIDEDFEDWMGGAYFDDDGL